MREGGREREGERERAAERKKQQEEENENCGNNGEGICTRVDSPLKKLRRQGTAVDTINSTSSFCHRFSTAHSRRTGLPVIAAGISFRFEKGQQRRTVEDKKWQRED